MARGGITRAIVQIARDALIARGINPSINAVRVELGNTGSMTTIARYLGELENVEPRPNERRERLSDQLSELIGQLLDRLLEEGAEEVAEARAELDKHRASVNEQLMLAQAALTELQRQRDGLQAALDVQASELSTSQSSLQSELTRNARLSQSCADLEVRVHEKDEQIRSLEEKHLHARDALEHYRAAVKDQRDQEQRRHEGQLQQIQVEHRQLQQTLSVKQDELSRLNRDNERLLSDSRQQAKIVTTQGDSITRLTGELNALAIASARNEGAKEQLVDQLAQSREETASLRESVAQAEIQAKNSQVLLEKTQNEVEHMRRELKQLQAENNPLHSERANDQREK
ncbi:DNA-binding protein [Pseudomonas chlororaphis]|uniref:DNA-binding protein n=1 Tax=Pseudomonas chlororaphis TaxID=587753 RepID=UPI0023684952|nr:DNA-binding protein [Pseudomonas chlororaphis]WDH32415.1 DNA-binding protein [Pseudomonas chlororaphis]WDH38499.1 DNA-binding protein [Pseudomonas chlororaphis]